MIKNINFRIFDIMRILHRKTNKLHTAVIEIVEGEDWSLIKESGEFDFNWDKERKYVLYKLRLEASPRILGLVAVKDFPTEARLHIPLIEVSRTNIGKNKAYDFIAGCMIAFVCKMAFAKKYEGFVSLLPKTEIIGLYINKYGFNWMGQLLFVAFDNAENLVKKYLFDEHK